MSALSAAFLHDEGVAFAKAESLLWKDIDVPNSALKSETKRTIIVIFIIFIAQVAAFTFFAAISNSNFPPALTADLKSDHPFIKNSGDREIKIKNYEVECFTRCVRSRKFVDHQLEVGEQLNIETSCPIKALHVYTDRGKAFFQKEFAYSRDRC